MGWSAAIRGEYDTAYGTSVPFLGAVVAQQYSALARVVDEVV